MDPEPKPEQPQQQPEPEPEREPEPEAFPRWSTASPGRLRGGPEIVLDFPGVESAQVQIASDLHLEFIREDCGAECDLDSIVAPSAPILALLGDIGIPTAPIYTEFLLKQAERYQAVLVLTGNHEFYDTQHEPPKPKEGQTWAEAERDRARHGVEDMERAIEEICSWHPALHFVDNRVVRLGRGSDAPALLCTPLWSHVPPDAMAHVGRSLNDYRMAYVRKPVSRAPEARLWDDLGDGGGWGSCGGGLESHGGGAATVKNAEGQPLRRLKPQDTSAWHALAVGWLERELARLQDAGVTAVAALSHHTPAMTGTSHPRFEGENADQTQHAFSSDLTELFGGCEILRVWAYGHTHWNNDRTVAGTRLLSNQRGYVHEVSEDYRPDLAFALQG